MNTEILTRRTLGFVPQHTLLPSSAIEAIHEFAHILQARAKDVDDGQALQQIGRWLALQDQLGIIRAEIATIYTQAYPNFTGDQHSLSLSFKGPICILRIDSGFSAELMLTPDVSLSAWGNGEDLLQSVSKDKGRRWCKRGSKDNSGAPLEEALRGAGSKVGQYDSFD